MTYKDFMQMRTLLAEQGVVLRYSTYHGDTGEVDGIQVQNTYKDASTFLSPDNQKKVDHLASQVAWKN